MSKHPDIDCAESALVALINLVNEICLRRRVYSADPGPGVSLSDIHSIYEAVLKVGEARRRHGDNFNSAEFIRSTAVPVPMILYCPSCHARHIDEGEHAVKPHHTHACQTCGTVWRPALAQTVGVQFLPGFKNK